MNTKDAGDSMKNEVDRRSNELAAPARLRRYRERRKVMS